MNRQIFDLVIYGKDGQQKLITEVKIKQGSTLNWAAQIHSRYAYGLLKSPFFLLALPQVFYLWKNPEKFSNNLIEPTYKIDAEPFLKPYFQKSGISPNEVSGSSFELIMFSWLNELLLRIKIENEVDSIKNEVWLFESGLLDEIIDGQVKAEVSILIG